VVLWYWNVIALIWSSDANHAMAKATAGPDPVLISRKEVDALYEILDAVTAALNKLGVDYIVTGGSLLGAVRQHSVLFCDDDIDIAIIENSTGTSAYDTVSANLAETLGPAFAYKIRPWEGADKIRLKRMATVFLDLFTIRRYTDLAELHEVIGVKANGQPQSDAYVRGIVDTITASSASQGERGALFPLWHFNTRKAVEMWPKEVYREAELFPLQANLKFGPLTRIKGPRTPALLLRRAFGADCFDVYYQSASHKVLKGPKNMHPRGDGGAGDASACSESVSSELQPALLAGGTWETSEKTPLEEQHYVPMQSTARAKRRATLHGREQLMQYLAEQDLAEQAWLADTVPATENPQQPRLQPQVRPIVVIRAEVARPRCTVYMDGVFDLFHVGHLEAVQQCVALGDRVIIGVTGDADATSYKRAPVIPETHRVAIMTALKGVDEVVCPCPLVVTEDFMKDKGIDLVVHGYASDADAEKQFKFFAVPMTTGRFKRIGYSPHESTTAIIDKIRAIPDDVKRAEQDRAGHTPASHEGVAAAVPPPRCPAPPATPKPAWFGAAVTAATGGCATLCSHPFPPTLLDVIDPHVQKARTRRDEALSAIREATGHGQYDVTLAQFQDSRLAEEGQISFNVAEHPLRAAFVRSSGLAADVDLCQLHVTPGSKDALFCALTREPHGTASGFQATFDRFVRQVCAPRLATLFECTEIYYQAYPCIRVVQPDEFSIGPHADVMYGHHPCSVNFYVPLTTIGGTSALFLESAPGREDWHEINGA
jgi:cytidyltransferase-like protein